MLRPAVADQVRKLSKELSAAGEMLSPAQLRAYYDAFRARFGPEVLRNLDGERLLETIHNHGNRDSLVYWLEFKNDEEFPALFGSIAGGSALKFGIYRRKETGTWMTGSPTAQRELSLEEAIQISRQHRDELLRGSELLAELPANGTDEDYRKLQEQMDRLAPSVSDSAWGHKYFTLMFPEKLDDFHNVQYQRFHLIKLLLVPPPGEGRYIVAGQYVSLSNEFQLPLCNFTRVLNKRDPLVHRYWRIGTSDGKTPRNRWDLMRDGSCVAIGWELLGDLAGVTYVRESKERLRGLLGERYPGKPQVVGRSTQQVFNFVTVVENGDLVAAADGKTTIAIARVKGGYYFEAGTDFCHRRPVEWLSVADWQLPNAKEGLQTTLHSLVDPANLVAIEEHLLGAPAPALPATKRTPGAGLPTDRGGFSVPPLTGIPGRIQAVLERKSQVILYGPPGTGKTYWAERTARDLAAYARQGRPFEALSDEERAPIVGSVDALNGTVRMCCFHPGYGYEEFIEGYRPEETEGRMVFALHDGIFKRTCQDAASRPGEKFYLIVDEINRGDVPRIMGELLTVIEKGKRGTPILLPLSATPLVVPPNLYLIGTMNTADRSIALLDTALRRRFGFVELMPDMAVLGDAVVGGVPLGPWLAALNQRICTHIGRDARNLQIGHSFLMDGDRPISEFAKLARALEEEIVPLLEEYCYEDYHALEQILGKGLVDLPGQRIKHELFAPERQAELVGALLMPCPEIESSVAAIASDLESNLDDAAGEGEPEGADKP